ncbi:MAG: tRNA (N(6)-L-threonylcarbamoyladenosine(37)-C(2))-methylthiotransferase MtaB [Lachnospiraceae bacterium]|jgi:threonylcarbamoyladenosine tRNA methylthiotransferase MtaB|nr:tRNA (N(6)-L-threonylcarbamoyladenosine(37)-C(2))-methylthiotransferase MtaB [Lachnospiraceae bacterium]
MKAALHNLGCKVNQYETDAMENMLREAGFEIVPFTEKADVYVINTCSVTNMADRKSRQMIHRVHKLNPQAAVVAAGCYVQTSEEQAKADEAIDIIIGNNQKTKLVEMLDKYFDEHLEDLNDLPSNDKVESLIDIRNTENPYEKLIVKHTSEHTRAFIKVQDGCNQFCTYCIIPYARGLVRSREVSDVVEEVRGLALDGYKEVVITGIHLSSYGMTENYNSNPDNSDKFLELVKAVHDIDGIERIRFGSIEPQVVTDKLAEELASLPKICPHFHLSLQSGCDATLKRMNRHYTTAEYKAGCDILRKYFHNPAITTDVIVGFPGETEEEFAETKKYLEEIEFYEMHVFKYSKRQGTLAEKMPNQVPEQVKAKRSDELLKLEVKMSNNYRRAFEGMEVEALLETPLDDDGDFITGYTREYIRVAVETSELIKQAESIGVTERQLETGDFSNIIVRGKIDTKILGDTYKLLI